MFIKTKKLLILILSLCVFTFVFTGCCDLADVEDEEDYYNIFGYVGTINGSSKASYTMSEFYNKETVENMETPMEYGPYNYLVIKPTIAFYLDEIAMYIKSTATESTTTVVNLYKMSSMPSVPDSAVDPFLNTFIGSYQNKDISIKLSLVDGNNKVEYTEGSTTASNLFTYNEDKTQVKFTLTIGTKLYGFECTIDYLGLHVNNTSTGAQYVLSSATSGNKLASTVVQTSNDEWSSFRITHFDYEGTTHQNQIKVNDGDYLVFEILNNDPSASSYGLQSVSWEGTNILIRIKKD